MPTSFVLGIVLKIKASVGFSKLGPLTFNGDTCETILPILLIHLFHPLSPSLTTQCVRSHKAIQLKEEEEKKLAIHLWVSDTSSRECF